MAIEGDQTRDIDNASKQSAPAAPSVQPDDTGDTPLRILEIIRKDQPETGSLKPVAEKKPAPPSAAVAPLSAPVALKASAPPSPTFATIHEAIGETKPKETPALNPGSGNTIPASAKDDSFVAKPGEVSALQHAADTELSPAAKAAPPSTNTQEEDEKEQAARPRIPAMRTLRDDMKDIVENKNMSVVRAGALEEARRHARAKGERASPESARGTGGRPQRRSGVGRIIVGIIILFVLGAVALGGFFFYRSLVQGPLEEVQNYPSLIFTEQTITLPLERTTPAILRTTLGSAREQVSGSPGSILRILPTVAETTSVGQQSSEPRIATAREFFEAMGAVVPAELLAALGGEYFLGIQAGDGNQPVLILSVTSYERAFSGMLAWEKTVSETLSPPFTRVPTTVQASDGSIVGNPFEDVVIRNYDVRLLNNPDGTPGLFYAFPNRQLLVITSSPYTLIEILSRLQAARNL